MINFNKKNYKFFQSILFLFLFTQSLYPQVKFENYNVKTGLPSNKVYFSLKDSRGFLWFATDIGLSRFDGIRFTNFKCDENDSLSLPEDVITQIYEISVNELLINTLSGKLTIYDYRTGDFVKLSYKKPWIKNHNISSFFRDSNDNYWFTTSLGLLKVDKKFNFIKEYRIPGKVQGHHLSNFVNVICEDIKGIFWLGMFYRGVVRFDPLKEIYDEKKVSHFIPHVQVRAIVAPSNSEFVYIATAGEGLFKVNVHNFSHTQWYNKKNIVDNSFPSNIISDICVQNDETLWVGSTEGISRFELKNNLITSYSHDSDKPYSLINNNVYHILSDKDGILWVSTFGGISKLNLSPPRFSKLDVNKSLPNLLSSNKVVGIHKDGEHNLWIATSKGIDLLEPEQKKSYHYFLPRSHRFHENYEIVRFFLDSEENFWIATWGGGISRTKIPKDFKPGNKLTFKNFYYDSLDTHSISSNFIRSFEEDSDGNLWVSTWNGGLNIISSDQKSLNNIEFQRITAGLDSTKSLASNYVHEIKKDNAGNLWLCTSKGLQRFNPVKKEFQIFYPEKGGIKNLINTSTHLLIDSHDVIWNGSFAGLTKVSKDNKGLYQSEVIYKDKYRGIYTMILAEDGKLWFTTVNSEIGFYDTETGKMKFYSMIEEVDGCEFYAGFPSKDNNGTIYFPGFSGVLYFNPERLNENKTIPPVYITSLRIAGKDFKANCDITMLRNLELDYDEVNVSLSLAALNYFYPEENEYKYILEGYDREWTELKNKSEIILASLRPGKYKLKIIGSNNDGYWNYEPVVLSIKVNPPFYQNVYFIVFLSFLLIGISLLLIQKKIKRLRLEREQQINFSKLLIQSQEEERKRLSSELHDSLGQNLLVIKNLMFLYNSSAEKSESDIEQISELIQDSIDEVKEISGNLHPHQLERLGLRKAIIAMINKIMRVSRINIAYNLDDLKGVINPEDKINLYRIIQESLNNIVKHSKASAALVEIKVLDEKIILKIEDNGIGLDFDNKALRVNFEEGFGLKSIKERTRLINGKLSIELVSTGGTRIVVELKINKINSDITNT